MSIRVIKMGGSLLLAEDLKERLNGWLEQETGHFNLLLVGGGPLVDVVRKFDEQHGLDEETSHWSSIRLLDISATLVESLGVCTNRTLDPLRWAKDLIGSELIDRNATIFHPYSWLKQHADSLPASWDVTSDSIAAFVARHVDANELVLLKSCSPKTNQIEDWMAAGGVDPAFVDFLPADMTVRWVNLKERTELIGVLSGSSSQTS